MAIYTGQVLPNTDDDFPFMAVISDDTGKVVGEFPVRTEADGEAKVKEALESLKGIAESDEPSA